MSVRMGVLALLVGGPGYGYQLRGEFEHRTGGSWPLNIGQVYTTLDRLERDGLVAGDADDDGHVVYTATDAGRAEVARWFSEPVPAKRGRDELAIKFALAVTVRGVDVARLVQVQRGAAIRNLQDLTRLKRTTDPSTDLAWSLVLESMVFQGRGRGALARPRGVERRAVPAGRAPGGACRCRAAAAPGAHGDRHRSCSSTP
ncbi:PadR family transcriptional regulator [Curtobacterium flaccumfaciens]|uniref:PadR family transcriptional regulator n=1 Tax=Curtobacterium flaccumfaciens TaxID=2035 RepID=UPI003556B23E